MSDANTTPEDLLARHGRSFHLAGRFLSLETRARATRLYAFCRVLDDLADEAESASGASKSLQELVGHLVTSAEPVAQLYRSLGLRDNEPADTLLRTLATDTGPCRFQNADELLRYAHGVAGTVGLMMSEVLGADSPEARPHALDLGVGMQLVNIARDVREDAERDRVYLPAEWLPAGADASALATRPEIAWLAAQRAIEEAEKYFSSGFRGIRHLPQKNQRGIWIAGRVYREIGQEILQGGAAGLRKRAVVPGWRKFLLTIGCLITPSALTPFGRDGEMNHNADLHRPLTGLCGIHLR